MRKNNAQVSEHILVLCVFNWIKILRKTFNRAEVSVLSNIAFVHSLTCVSMRLIYYNINYIKNDKHFYKNTIHSLLFVCSQIVFLIFGVLGILVFIILTITFNFLRKLFWKSKWFEYKPRSICLLMIYIYFVRSFVHFTFNFSF